MVCPINSFVLQFTVQKYTQDLTIELYLSHISNPHQQFIWPEAYSTVYLILNKTTKIYSQDLQSTSHLEYQINKYLKLHHLDEEGRHDTMDQGSKNSNLQHQNLLSTTSIYRQKYQMSVLQILRQEGNIYTDLHPVISHNSALLFRF